MDILSLIISWSSIVGIQSLYNPLFLKTSVGRHTTSKLNKYTLNNVVTLGFRGEALHSISNASDFTMTTRTKDSTEAHELKVIFEPGRYVIADSCQLISKVLYVKELKDDMDRIEAKIDKLK